MESQLNETRVGKTFRPIGNKKLIYFIGRIVVHAVITLTRVCIEQMTSTCLSKTSTAHRLLMP